MYYPCAKFGHCTFSRFGFIVRTHTQTDIQTDSHRITVTVHLLKNAMGIGNGNNCDSVAIFATISQTNEVRFKKMFNVLTAAFHYRNEY